MLGKLIRTLYYILFFATPLVMFSKTSEIFEFNKLILIYLFTVAIGSLWLIQYIVKEKKKFKLTLFHWIVIAFVASQVLSTFFSIDRHTSLFGYYGRFNGGLFSIFAYAALLFILISQSSVPFIKNLLKVSLASSLCVILWGLPGKFNVDLTCGLFTGTFNNSCWTNQFQPAERMFSTLGQPNWLGAYLAITFFIGIYFYLKTVFFKTKNIFLDYAVLMFEVLTFTTILFTRSRSALGAVVIGLVVFPLFFYYFKKSEFFGAIVKKYFILCVLLAISVIIFKTGSDKIDKHIPFSGTTIVKPTVSARKTAATQANAINVTDSFDIRKIVWKGAWQLALKYPIFGTGVETFAYSYYFTRPIEHNATSEWDYLYNKAHNEFINYLATTGFVGMLTYLAMIAAVVFLFIKRMETDESLDYKLLALSSFIAYVTIQVTDFFGFSTTTVSLFFYALPVVFLTVRPTLYIPKLSKKLILRQKASIVCVVISFIVGLYLVGSYWVADVRYEDAQSDIQNGHYSQGAYKLLNILKFHYEHVYEDKLSIALIGTSLTTEDKKDSDKLILMSEYYNEKALQASPYNVLYWKSRASILYNAYQVNSDKTYLEKALTALQTAEKVSPTDPRLPYTGAQYASLLYDAEKKPSYLQLSQQQIETALKLKPDYTDALEFKATLLQKLNKSK